MPCRSMAGVIVCLPPRCALQSAIIALAEAARRFCVGMSDRAAALDIFASIFCAIQG